MQLDASFLSRRAFLKKNGCAALGLVGVTNMLAQLRMVHNASAQVGTNDYKALVCVFLYGGNDANNTILPTGPQYAPYNDDRGALAIEENLINPFSFTDALGRVHGMHPNLNDGHLTSPSLYSLFESGQCAVVGNVGTLVQPVEQEGYFDRTVQLPPQLFSHQDQQRHWQSSVPDQPFASGWGGRLADRMFDNNVGAKTSMSVSIAGHNDFMVGNELAATQLHLTSNGPIALQNYGNPINPSADSNNGRLIRGFDKIMDESMSNLFAEEYRERVATARRNNALIADSIKTLSLPADYPDFPTHNLGRQLEMVSKMIAIRSSLNQKRQLFFVAIGGYDTHADQLAGHADRMSELSGALGAFYQSTVSLGVANDVTSFTCSDFNRTYSPNTNDGSDHAWGGHAMVVGGSVKGKEIYGLMPDLVLGGVEDTELVTANRTSRGRWIPSTSVDEYAATLAKWYGIPPAELGMVFPNINRFATPDLGFML